MLPTYTENILGFAVAYGLAVQGLNHARLVTNLLPGEIRFDRLVRAKKPWVVTAAASCCWHAAMALDAYLEYRSFGHPEVLSAEKKAKDASGTVTDAENAFQKAKAQAKAEERAVPSIVAGQARRTKELVENHEIYWRYYSSTRR